MNIHEKNMLSKNAWKRVPYFASITICSALLLLGVYLFIHSSRYPRHVVLGYTRYDIEVSDTEEKRREGLSKRASLCQNCVMLFVFPQKGRFAFGMQDMQFPIDIIWLQDDIVVKIERNISPSSKDVLRPEEESNRVLEMNAGDSEALRIGDRVRYE